MCVCLWLVYFCLLSADIKTSTSIFGLVFFLCLYLKLFCYGVEDLTHGLTRAGQMLYHWSLSTCLHLPSTGMTSACPLPSSVIGHLGASYWARGLMLVSPQSQFSDVLITDIFQHVIYVSFNLEMKCLVEWAVRRISLECNSFQVPYWKIWSND